MEGIVERKCNECIFYNYGQSNCQRYPTFILRKYNEWCGEFKDKWQVRVERVDP